MVPVVLMRRMYVQAPARNAQQSVAADRCENTVPAEPRRWAS